MDRRVVLILSLVVAFTGVVMVVKGHSRASNVVDLSVAQPSGVQQQDSAKKDVDAPPPEFPEPQKGSAAPDFSLKSLPDGKEVRLSSLRGKAVLVNFWATWCEPCKIEMPSLVDLQKKYGPQGLQIVGVAMDDADDKEISTFAHKMGVNYLVLRGTEEVGDHYGGIDRLPMTYYLDRSGKVVDETMGMAGEATLEDAIKRALAQGN
ncbi:MAG TPA: TlpA disulfide reductase family protein [Candidatus Binatia bacterium]|nr:TlpA disulfide reductase family protein [Candidatus Binatia bacterium]